MDNVTVPCDVECCPWCRWDGDTYICTLEDVETNEYEECIKE